MSSVVLQVPISKTLKKRAETVANEYGISLTDAVKKLLGKLVQRELPLDEPVKAVRLSARAKKRYEKALDDIEHDRNIYKPKNDEEFFKLLRS